MSNPFNEDAFERGRMDWYEKLHGLDEDDEEEEEEVTDDEDCE